MKGAMTLFSARTRRRPTRTSRNTMGMSQYFLRYLRNCQSGERTSLSLITRSSRNDAGRDSAPGRATTSKAARARAAFDVVALPGAESRPASLRDDLVMRESEVLSPLWQFLKYRKKYWLMPIVFLLVLVGLLLVLAEKSVIAPFIYTLF